MIVKPVHEVLNTYLCTLAVSLCVSLRACACVSARVCLCVCVTPLFSLFLMRHPSIHLSLIFALSPDLPALVSEPWKPCWQKPCWQIYALDLHHVKCLEAGSMRSMLYNVLRPHSPMWTETSHSKRGLWDDRWTFAAQGLLPTSRRTARRRQRLCYVVLWYGMVWYSIA